MVAVLRGPDGRRAKEDAGHDGAVAHGRAWSRRASMTACGARRRCLFLRLSPRPSCSNEGALPEASGARLPLSEAMMSHASAARARRSAAMWFGCGAGPRGLRSSHARTSCARQAMLLPDRTSGCGNGSVSARCHLRIVCRSAQMPNVCRSLKRHSSRSRTSAIVFSLLLIGSPFGTAGRYR
jgi:hypothetical protein